MIWPGPCDSIVIYGPRSPFKEGLVPRFLGTVSRQPTARSPLWELPLLQRTNLPKVTPLHGVANIQWPISARVQSCSLAHLRTTLKVISTLGLPPWHWPKLWLDLHYNSASPFLPLFYKCWSHCLFLINLLQVKPISVSESWKTQSETPHLPQFYLPTKTFLLQVPNKHRVEAAHFRWL